jgi:hypothetical protein
LRDGIAKVRTKISMEGYQDYLDSERYVQFVRKQFVRPRLFSGASAIASRRLFILEARGDEPIHELTQVACAVAGTVIFTPRTGSFNGPLPLFGVRGLDSARHAEFKRDLFDTLQNKGFYFLDGTPSTDHDLHVRMISSNLERHRPHLRLVSEQVAQDANVMGPVQEILQFFRQEPINLPTGNRLHTRIHIASPGQALRILKPS